MLTKKIKRFFETVDVASEENGYSVRLDGRSVRTPEGSALLLPSTKLADRIAVEWSAQEDDIKPLSMPLMRLACTAIDKVSPVREHVIEQLVRYGESDLLCYRAERPDDLVRLQSESWQPVLDWLLDSKSVSLNVTAGIVHIPQPEDSLSKLALLIAEYDDFNLCVLGELTQLTGSLTLGLACVDGRINGAYAFEASQLDDDWQAEQWGQDHEAIERRKNLEADINAAIRFLEALQ